MLTKLAPLLFCTFLLACEESKTDQESVTDVSQQDIEQILDEVDRSEEDRDALREQLEALREACENGDEEACQELRERIAELEAEREDDSDREDTESDREEEDECEDGDTLERGDKIYECVNGRWVLQDDS